MMILFFIYAILGYFLFSSIIDGDVINDNFTNFSNFGTSLIVLLRSITGEDWNIIMFDTVSALGRIVSVIYFTSFRLIGSNVMLNLFVLVILQQFNTYYVPADSVISKFKDNLEHFKQVWKNFSIRYGGLKVKEN